MRLYLYNHKLWLGFATYKATSHHIDQCPILVNRILKDKFQNRKEDATENIHQLSSILFSTQSVISTSKSIISRICAMSYFCTLLV